MTLMRSLRRFVRHRANLFWVAVLVAIIVSAVLAPLLATAHPDEGHLMDSLQGPSWGHLLGTDSVGRDLLARTLFGGRVALLAAAEVLGIAIVAGVPTGMAIGFVGGWIDRIVMRIIEAIISLPFLVIAIALISVTGPGLVKSMAIVGVIYATWLARLARGQVLAAREELYVDAGRVAGNSGWRLLSRQILPNVAPALIVQGTLMFAMAIVAESTLSFLGLGVQPPTASWGSMLADAQGLARTGLWPAVPPGIAIVLTVLALNQVGDGLRDVLAREAKGGVLGVGSVALLAAGSDPTIDEAAPSEVGARDGEELLLDLRHLRVTFPGDHGVPVEVVTDVSLQLRRGEILGLVEPRLVSRRR